MGEYVVKSANRLFEREAMNRFDGDLAREIAELITNSIDSYGRIKDFNDKKVVRIELDKAVRKSAEKYVIRVIDNAEGMTQDTLIKIFGERGADNNGGTENGKIRGLFGLGASDCMRASAIEGKSAEYCSFKDGEVTILRYNVNNVGNDFIIKDTIITDSNKIADLRKKYAIPQNGTVATFGIPDSVILKDNIADLKHEIESIYLLRDILSDDSIEVYLTAYGETIKLSSKDYILSNPILKDVNISFKFKNRIFKGIISFYKNENKLANPTDILVKDDRGNYYDNQLFGYNRAQGNENLSGILTLYDFWSELEYFLNVKKIALLKDDRTGFDITKQFGRELVKALTEPIANAINILLKEKGSQNISLSNTKNYTEFLKFLNRDLHSNQTTPIGGRSDMEKVPPALGIEFARNNISVTAGHSYDLKIYINKSQIYIGDSIVIEAIGNNENIVFTKEIVLTEDDFIAEIPVKSCLITAEVETTNPVELYARCGEYSSNCNVSVIKEEILYPENGIQFEKSNVIFSPDINHKKIKLYFDKSKIKNNDLILITDTSNGKLKCTTPTFTIESGNMINENMGFILLEFSGGDLNDEYTVVASCKNGYDTLNVSIKATKHNNHEKLGDIAGYELVNDETATGAYQSWFDINDKKVKIDVKNKINKAFVSEWNDTLNKKSLNQLKPKSLYYVISLVCFESAQIYAKREFSQGHIQEGNYEEYMQIVEEKKNQYFNAFLNIESR